MESPSEADAGFRPLRAFWGLFFLGGGGGGLWLQLAGLQGFGDWLCWRFMGGDKWG